MILSAIAAMASNRTIGNEGKLPWNLPEDFKYFKTKTKGHIIIMGRKTFESLPKLLPDRLHVIISRKKNYKPEGAHVFSSPAEALLFCNSQTGEWGKEVFIIGGAEIYQEFMPIVSKIYLTEIHKKFPGDTFFPEFDHDEFKEVSRKTHKDTLKYDFVVYERP